MALNIKDPETDAIVRRLAELVDEPITVAVRKAAEERLEREEQARGRASIEELMAIIDEYAVQPVIDPDFTEASLYDENGLPA